MLDKETGIDAVTVETTDNLHAAAAMAALKRGKHVYCQKPLTHDIYEARALALAAREAKVATQMGNQGHAMEGNKLIYEWIQAGAIGEVTKSVLDRPPGGNVAPGHRSPQRDTLGAPGAQLESVAGAGAGSALPPDLLPVPMAWLLGFRHRFFGRHGLPHHGHAGICARAPASGQHRGRGDYAAHQGYLSGGQHHPV